MECSRSPLDLESRHAEVSAPRAQIFWRGSSGLLSLREFKRPPLTGVRGNCERFLQSSAGSMSSVRECGRPPLDSESRHAEVSLQELGCLGKCR